MMIYLIVAIALIIVVSTIIYSYKKEHDKKRVALSTILLTILLICTYASKVLLIYKPIFVLHLALLITGWRYYSRYLFQHKLNIYWILSPTISIVLFIAISLFFRENG